MKNLPGHARGAMTILLTFFMGLGALLFNGVGGPVFDTMGPSSPFVLVSIFDMILCAFAIALGCSGHLTANFTQNEADKLQTSPSPDRREPDDNPENEALPDSQPQTTDQIRAINSPDPANGNTNINSSNLLITSISKEDKNCDLKQRVQASSTSN